MENEASPERVIVYIDGYSLYHGLKDGGFGDCLWLDIPAFSRKLLEPKHELVEVKYFTSRTKAKDPEKRKRQNTYLEALEEHAGLKPIYGRQMMDFQHCNSCHDTWKEPREKWTDVNIAIHLLEDALSDRFDTAFLVSGDSDYVPLVRRVRDIPGKSVIHFQPPKRPCNLLKHACNDSRPIWKDALRGSQLPASIISKSGAVLLKPEAWEGKKQDL